MIGIWGALITLLIFIPLCFILKGPYTSVLAIFFILLVFFTGFIFGGIKSSVKWITYIFGLIVLAALSGRISIWLQYKNIVSPQIRNLVSYAILIIISFCSYKIISRLFRKFEDADTIKGTNEVPTEQELDELERNYKKDSIYLIEPKTFNVDIVFKIIIKDNSLYYCRVGGQFYEIDEISLKYSCESDDKALLSDVSSYKIPLNFIRDISLSRKKSLHTGHLPNNGILCISIDNVKNAKKYIIHPINEYDEVKTFFEKVKGISLKEK